MTRWISLLLALLRGRPRRWRPAITTTGRLLTLDEIRSEVMRITSRLGGPPVHMEPHYGQSDQGGTPHIEVDDRYHYVVCERGREFERQSTAELDTLLYWIARDLTW